MKELRAFPPNYRELVRLFPIRGKNVFFAWGETIYNPSGVKLSPAIRAHEELHGARQLAIGPETWWQRYVTDGKFRLNEELVAHRVEWQRHEMIHHNDEQYLDGIATRLSGPLYGRMISFQEAKQLIAL